MEIAKLEFGIKELTKNYQKEEFQSLSSEEAKQMIVKADKEGLLQRRIEYFEKSLDSFINSLKNKISDFQDN